MNESHGGKCGCTCHKMNGIFITLTGLTFLLGHLEVISQHVAGIAWPVFVVLYGLQNSFGKGLCKCCSKHNNAPG